MPSIFMDCLTEAYKTTKFGNLYRFNVTSGRRMESFEGRKKQFSFSKVIMACSFRLAHSIDLLYYISERENMRLIIELLLFFGFCCIKKSWNMVHITKRFDSNFCVLSSCRIPIRQSNTIRVSEKRKKSEYNGGKLLFHPFITTIFQNFCLLAISFGFT